MDSFQTSSHVTDIDDINRPPVRGSRPAASPLSHPKVFRIGDIGSGARGDSDTFTTGFAELDMELSGAGWQKQGLTEILCDHTGIGELSLLMKGLSLDISPDKFSDAINLMWVLSANQSWIPYAPALARGGISLERLAIVGTKSTDEALWAAEQGLKSGACRAVLLRMNETYCSPLSLRRLLQAAIAGRSAALLSRPLAAAALPSPAGTRIVLRPEEAGVLCIELLKRRGLPPGKSVRVMTRTLPCLQRAQAAVRETKSAKPATETTPPRWLENIVSGTASNQVKLRSRMLDPNRR
jgi:cell division inhibitor SulA/protein ImuA